MLIENIQYFAARLDCKKIHTKVATTSCTLWRAEELSTKSSWSHNYNLIVYTANGYGG